MVESANSNLGRSIVNDYFNLPQPKKLYSWNEFFPMFLSGMMLSQWDNYLKPYSSSNLERVFLIFNYRSSRAKGIIENTFRILAARFRIFRRPLLSCLETIENITKACVALHNYLMTNKKIGEGNSYCPNKFIDEDVRRNGEWLEIVKDDSGLIPLSRNCSNNYSRDAKVMRDMFCNYFNSPEGAVPRQLDMVSVTISK